MPSVELTDNEWGQLMNLISTAPWRDANPLLMKIGDQLRAQHQLQQQSPTMASGHVGGNSQEVRDGQ
jgi:hypothetical protein